MTRPTRNASRRSRSAYLVQVLILVDADHPTKAWDGISDHLTDRGIYGEHTAILDWYPCEDGPCAAPLPVRIPVDFEPDSLGLQELLPAKGGAS